MIDNPFTALTLIAAPAVLTNASSVLALGTSNRFARAVDRARALSQEMADADPKTVDTEWRDRQIRYLGRVERRCLLLVRSLSLFYLALGSFGVSALVSLLGAVASTSSHKIIDEIISTFALLAGTVGVASLAIGCSLLLRETRLAILNLTEEASNIRKRFGITADPETVKLEEKVEKAEPS